MGADKSMGPLVRAGVMLTAQNPNLCGDLTLLTGQVTVTIYF
jgi:hypothetical protein